MSIGAAMTPVVLQHATCKCCESQATLWGVTDFNRSCEDRRQAPRPLSGIPIYYYHCPGCGLVFTTAFDHFSREDFSTYIYNSEYVDVDPDFLTERPAATARACTEFFAGSRNISILDYGGGNGSMADHLRANGFTDVTTYDPFVPAHATRPERQFDLITAFEVMEHTNRPAQTRDDMIALLNPEGLLMFSTLLIPDEIAPEDIGWWYIAPRNGHVTLYSKPSLKKLLATRGFSMASKNGHLHIAWKAIPGFARHLVPA